MTVQPIPAERLYPLLSAIDPDLLAKGQTITVGAKRGRDSQGAFLSLLETAREARSARQFAEKLNGGGKSLAAVSESTSKGAITDLTVEYKADGYTEVRVRFENGDQIISVFPTRS
ncbi:MAG: hypothetical protein ACJ76J_14085 [Thermoanaerobaculia bacterium]